MRKPSAEATASRTRRASATTSGPIPSPRISPMRYERSVMPEVHLLALGPNALLGPIRTRIGTGQLLVQVGHQAPRLDDVTHEVGEGHRRGGDALREVADRPGGQVDLDLVALLAHVHDLPALHDRQPDVDRVAEEDPGERRGDDAGDPAGPDGDGGVLPGGAGPEVLAGHDDVALPDPHGERGVEVLEAVLRQLRGVGGVEVAGRDDDVGVHVGAEAVDLPSQRAHTSAPTFSGWVIRPVMAVAAATAGFASQTSASRWPMRPR